MKIAIIGLLCGVAVAIQAQAPPPRDAGAPVVVPTGTGSLAGVVMDGESHPIRRAAVAISGDMRLNRSTITDDAGRFSFLRLPKGRFTITASKSGYPEMLYGAKRPYRAGSGVSLADGQGVNGIVLKLARGAVLTGTVLDDKGQPMPGVPIMAWTVRTTLAGERTIESAPASGNGVVSDDRGIYRVYGLPPGEYTIGTAWFFSSGGVAVRVPTDAEVQAAFLAVTQPGRTTAVTPTTAPPVEAPGYSYAPVFYPSATDPLAATAIPLGAGEEREGIDLRMQFVPMFKIAGVVQGPDGLPRDTEMMLFRRSRVTALNSTTHWSTQPTGRFTTSSLGPGDFTVMAQLRATAEHPLLWASADVTISGSDPPELTLNLQPGMTMAGHLVFEGATKPPADLSRARLSLLPLQGTSAGLNYDQTVDPSGAFSVVGLTPGRFRFGVTLPAGAPGDPAWTLSSVSAGDRNLTDLPIEVTTSGAPQLSVTFTDHASELSGTLRTSAGESPSDFFVIVIAADRAYWLPGSRRIKSVRPDINGRYVFSGLPAGDYRIAATTDLVQSDLGDTSALAQLAGQSAPVSLGPGEKKTFDLKIGG